MTKIRQFFFTLHQSSPQEKLQAIDFCRTLKTKWFMVALEPYLPSDVGRTGHHLHVIFQLAGSACSPQAVKARVMKHFKKASNQCFQAQGLGRFSQCVHYITCETAGDHENNPKILDPEPYIWPDDFQEDAPRRSDADSVIEDIRNGATLPQLLNAYPRYVMNNLSRIRNFIVEAQAAGFIRPNMALINGVPVELRAPWE